MSKKLLVNKMRIKMSKLMILTLSVFSITLSANAGTNQLNECRLYSYNFTSEVYLIKQVGETVQASLNTSDAITDNIVVNGLVPYTIKGMTSRTVTVEKEGASKVNLVDIVQNKDILSQVLTSLTENSKGVTQAIQNFSIENDCM